MIGTVRLDRVRALRLGAFAASATVLALGAHVVAGGAPPSLPLTLPAVALSAAAGYVLTRRRRGRLEIAVVLGAVQLVLHEILAAATGPSGHAGHSGAPEAGGWMLAAHLAAVLLTATVLAHGERLLHVLAERLRSLPPLSTRPATPVLLVRARPGGRPGTPVHIPSARRACAPLVRRGPPLPGC